MKKEENKLIIVGVGSVAPLPTYLTSRGFGKSKHTTNFPKISRKNNHNNGICEIVIYKNKCPYCIREGKYENKNTK